MPTPRAFQSVCDETVEAAYRFTVSREYDGDYAISWNEQVVHVSWVEIMADGSTHQIETEATEEQIRREAEMRGIV